MKLKLFIKDSDGRLHEPIVDVDVSNASFLKLAAVNEMQLVGAEEVRPSGSET